MMQSSINLAALWNRILSGSTSRLVHSQQQLARDPDPQPFKVQNPSSQTLQSEPKFRTSLAYSHHVVSLDVDGQQVKLIHNLGVVRDQTRVAMPVRGVYVQLVAQGDQVPPHALALSPENCIHSHVGRFSGTTTGGLTGFVGRIKSSFDGHCLERNDEGRKSRPHKEQNQ